MNKGKILIAIGMPRAGKSTYANCWVRQPSELPRVIVCADDFRLALHGQRFASRAESMVAATVNVAIRALYERGHHVLCDETSTSETSIRRILEIDREADYILIDTPKFVCIERAYSTNQSDLVPVIERIHLQLEKLKEEGIDNVFNRIRGSIK